MGHRMSKHMCAQRAGYVVARQRSDASSALGRELLVSMSLWRVFGEYDFFMQTVLKSLYIVGNPI